MKYSFTKTQVSLAISCILALGAVSSVVNADSNLIEREYVTDEWQNVFTNDYGECWHTGTALPLLENSVPCKASFAALEAPVTAAPIPTPEPLVVTFGVDTMFDFDKAELRPSGRMELDAFISKLNDMKPESVTVVGHTDRLGSDDYNQLLSTQRAKAVKSYMVSKGVPADTIQAIGKGETQPVTKAGECDAAKTDKSIACLQPNRRVVTIVIGKNLENVNGTDTAN
jgi:OOP family OmpA-OmpF porin